MSVIADQDAAVIRMYEGIIAEQVAALKEAQQALWGNEEKGAALRSIDAVLAKEVGGMSEFHPELIRRCKNAAVAAAIADPTIPVHVAIIAILRESGYAELVEALLILRDQYDLFVGPDDQIANSIKAIVAAALAKAGVAS